MAEASPPKADEKELSSSYFILDETGDSSIGPCWKADDQSETVKGEVVGVSAEVNGEETFETVDECVGMSTDSSPMKQTTPEGWTPAKLRKKANKRKRRQTMSTPTGPKRAKPSLATPGKVVKRKRIRKKKKSVIVIGDSDSEQGTSHGPPDISVVEIDDDDDSVIVLSDDEVGLCSGSLSATKRPLQPRNNINPSAKPFCSVKPPIPTKRRQNATKISPLKAKTPTPTEEPQEKNHFEMYNPQTENNRSGLRPIVIDGSNVAFGHGRDRFSSLGLKICVDYFKKMGHEVRAFVPQFRKTHVATVDPQILEALEKDGTLSFTPSRRTDGKMIVSYDDRFIVQYADATGGVIVSRDNYRDLVNENPEYKETIHKRLLMFTWVGDTIMFPKDPLGRGGPNLQEFLQF